jgi:hypothetical protein
VAPTDHRDEPLPVWRAVRSAVFYTDLLLTIKFPPQFLALPTSPRTRVL